MSFVNRSRYAHAKKATITIRAACQNIKDTIHIQINSIISDSAVSFHSPVLHPKLKVLGNAENLLVTLTQKFHFYFTLKSKSNVLFFLLFSIFYRPPPRPPSRPDFLICQEAPPLLDHSIPLALPLLDLTRPSPGSVLLNSSTAALLCLPPPDTSSKVLESTSQECSPLMFPSNLSPP